MKAKELIKILKKYPEKEIKVADWSEQYVSPTVLKNIIMNKEYILLEDEFNDYADNEGWTVLAKG